MCHAWTKDDSTHLAVLVHDESIPPRLASRSHVVRELYIGYLTKPLEGPVKVDSRFGCQLVTHNGVEDELT
jgi:hypothetical protein